MNSTNPSAAPERNMIRNVVIAFAIVEALGIAALIFYLIGR